MSRLHKLVPLLGGLLLSRGGRRVAGRHAGKLALATLAYAADARAPAPRSAPAPVRAGAAAPRDRPRLPASRWG